MTRTKFDVIREINATEREILEDGELNIVNVEAQKRIVQLKHELRMFSVRPATGEKAEAVKKLWLRKAEVERKKSEAQEKRDKEIIEAAKNKAKKELKKDKNLRNEIAKDLSVEELQELINQKENEGN